MNKRSFILSLVAVAIAPWKAICSTRRKPFKRILEQVFPKTLEELPGLYCSYRYDNQVYPYQIIRIFDDLHDLWMGHTIDNSRCNKWWAKSVDGSVMLFITGSKFNDPDTLFFRKV